MRAAPSGYNYQNGKLLAKWVSLLPQHFNSTVFIECSMYTKDGVDPLTVGWILGGFWIVCVQSCYTSVAFGSRTS